MTNKVDSYAIGLVVAALLMLAVIIDIRGVTGTIDLLWSFVDVLVRAVVALIGGG